VRGRGDPGHDLGIADDSSRDELTAELAELRAENARLRGLLGLDRRAENAAATRWSPSLFNEQQLESEATDALLVDGASPRPAKVALFGALFVGRDDVHALRWENTRVVGAGSSRPPFDSFTIPLGLGQKR
jgi:hypothetical protein